MQYRDGRYHRSICWFNEFDCQFANAKKTVNSIVITDHVYEKQYTSSERKYSIGKITLDKVFAGKVINVGVINGLVSTFCIRFNYDKKDDMIGVFSMNCNELIGVTFWLKNKADKDNNPNYDLYINDVPKDDVAISTSTIASRVSSVLFQKLMKIATH